MKGAKLQVKSSPLINQRPTFYRQDALPVAQPRVSEHANTKIYVNIAKKIMFSLSALLKIIFSHELHIEKSIRYWDDKQMFTQ